jgi:excisionase family DNA binding protein
MEAQDTVEQWVSVGQIAQHLNVKTFTIYKWLERKHMPAHKVGRLWRFKITEIDEWVRNGGAAEDAENKVKEK